MKSVRPQVVCVDDDPGVLGALRRLMRSEPIDVRTTGDPFEALRWASEGRVDLLIADQRMPGLSGTELVVRVRAASPATAVMILTAYPETAVIVERDHLRIERLLLKPWVDDELRRTVRELAGIDPAPVPDLRLDCRGLTDRTALVRLLPAVAAARGEIRIEVQNLSGLEGSVARLLLDLVRLAADHDIQVVLIDASGYAAALLGAIGTSRVVAR